MVMFVRNRILFQSETVNIVDNQMDLADYISFLTTTTKTELNYNFKVFSTDVGESSCVDSLSTAGVIDGFGSHAKCELSGDPVEPDYFKSLKE